MRKLISWLSTFLAVVILTFTANTAWRVYQDQIPCRRPLTYKVVAVDPRFNVSEKTVEQLAREAGAAWDLSSGRNLFQFDGLNGKIAISLVYDQRQAEAEVRQAERSKINAAASTLEELESRYEVAKSAYNKALSSYQQTVAYWNSKGGAPADEYARVESQRQALNGQADDVNQLAKDITAKARSANKTVDAYNQNVGKVFEEGQFETGQRQITVFQFDDQAELKMVLAHELGHALGLGHVESEAALMSPVHSEGDAGNLQITSADLFALNQLCGAK